MMENILTIDVEDWTDRIAFREKYRNQITLEHSNVNEGMHNIINLLKKYNQRATFFFLGKTVQKNPDLVKLVHENNFEIASHGFSHKPLSELTPELFKKELILTEKLIKIIVDCKIIGYRAPRFSLSKDTSWAVDILKDLGYRYDSSIYPAWAGNYGFHSKQLTPYFFSSKNLYKEDSNSSFIEFPLAVFDIFKFSLPLKMRLIGSHLTSKVIRNYNEKGKLANIYIHPWEVARKFDLSNQTLKQQLRNLRIPSNNQLEYILRHHKFGAVKDILPKIEKKHTSN